MIIIKVIVVGPLLFMAFSLTFVFRRYGRTISDFKVERIRYSNAYIHTYGVSRRYHNIVIVSGEEKYTLPNTESQFESERMKIAALHVP
jgi:hypothetical protein